MDHRSRGIDEIIQNAIKQGAFDNLPGKGKPLDLNESAFIDPEWRLAFHVLQENGFAPEFIERRKSIEMELASAREMLARAGDWRARALQNGELSSWVNGEWKKARTRFEEIVSKLNKEIRDHNLSIPTPAFHRKLIDLEAELSNLEETNK
jgi:DnaJ homolog subfamily C member 28